MIHPQADITIKMHQSSLKLAENGTGYRYTIAASKRADIANLKSDNEAKVHIMIDANESKVALYEQ